MIVLNVLGGSHIDPDEFPMIVPGEFKGKKVSIAVYRNFTGAIDILLNEKGEPDDLSDLDPYEREEVLSHINTL